MVLSIVIEKIHGGEPVMLEDALVTEDLSFKQDELPADRTLVIVDDDRAFLQRLARAMELRGFEVRFGHSVAEGVDLIREKPPAFAVVDMRLEDGSGLDVIAELAKVRPDSTGDRSDRVRQHRHRRHRREAWRRRLSCETGRCRRRHGCASRADGLEGAAAGKSNVGRPGALGAHSARLRVVQSQRLGDGAPLEHASAYPAAHFGEARAEVTSTRLLSLQTYADIEPCVQAHRRHPRNRQR